MAFGCCLQVPWCVPASQHTGRRQALTVIDWGCPPEVDQLTLRALALKVEALEDASERLGLVTHVVNMESEVRHLCPPGLLELDSSAWITPCGWHFAPAWYRLICDSADVARAIPCAKCSRSSGVPVHVD